MSKVKELIEKHESVRIFNNTIVTMETFADVLKQILPNESEAISQVTDILYKKYAEKYQKTFPEIKEYLLYSKIENDNTSN